MSTLRPREATVPLFQGDDLAEIQRLEGDVQRALSYQALARVGDTSSASQAAAAYDQYVAEATNRAVQVRLQALPRKKWRDLVTAHPARPGDEDDQAAGFDIDGMSDELLIRSVVALTCADPEVDVPNVGSDREVEEFLDSLSDGDFSRLFTEAVKLNRGVGPDPKADMSSRIIRTSVETSGSVPRLG